MIKKYKSKISIGLIILIFIVYLIAISYLWFDFKIGGFITIISLIIFIIYLFSTTYYIINQTTQLLLIKSGFLVNLTIDIHQIKEIKTSKIGLVRLLYHWIESKSYSTPTIQY